MNNKSDSLLKNHNSAWKLFNVCHYRFIDQSGFLDLASQGKLSQVIFINNSNFIFGVLKDGSLIRHDYLNNDSLIQIQDSLNKSGTKIFNIENDAATINIVLFVISLLLITILMISFIFACISVAKINSLEKKLKEISNHKIDLNLNKNYALIRDQVSSLSQKVSELEASKSIPMSRITKLPANDNKSKNKDSEEINEKDNPDQKQRIYDQDLNLSDVIIESDETREYIEEFISNQKKDENEISPLFKNDIKPKSSLLLYGPPGIGKTLLGHAIANELDIEIFYTNATKFKPYYANQSPKMIEDFFKNAINYVTNNNKKVVVMIDEADEILTKRKANESSSDKQQNQATTSFLTHIDQLHAKYGDKIIFICATNHKDSIDPAILNRLHEKIELPRLSKDKQIELFYNKFGIYKSFVNQEFITNVFDAKNQNIIESFSGRDLDKIVNETRCKIIKKINDSNDQGLKQFIKENEDLLKQNEN